MALIHLNDVKPTPGESEGLPIVLLEEGKKIKIIRFNFEPSWIDKCRLIIREAFILLLALSPFIILIAIIFIASRIASRFWKSPPGQEGGKLLSRWVEESPGDTIRKYIEVTRTLKEQVNQLTEQLKNRERVLSAEEVAKLREILKISQSI